jgi:hypothetical protein
MGPPSRLPSQPSTIVNILAVFGRGAPAVQFGDQPDRDHIIRVVGSVLPKPSILALGTLTSTDGALVTRATAELAAAATDAHARSRAGQCAASRADKTVRVRPHPTFELVRLVVRIVVSHASSRLLAAPAKR